jgi:outer membrane cobalamin receptor
MFFVLQTMPRFLLSALLILLYSTAVCAQDEKLHVLIDDGEVEHRIGEVDRDITSSNYSVISSDRLRESFVSLPEVLEQEVGVQIRSTGGVGSLSTINLRGSSNEQVIIYLDGVALNDASGGPVDLSMIPVDSIERIEIYRGSTPLALGSPSIGGAVNIISRRAKKQADGSGQQQVSATMGSFNTYQVSGSSSSFYEKDDILLNASYLKSKNDFRFKNKNGTEFNKADDNKEKRNNDGVKHLTLLSSWKHRISKRFDTAW